MLTARFLALPRRRQELRELRLLQKEEQRAQQQLSNKLQQQREQMYRRFEQETTVSHSPAPPDKLRYITVILADAFVQRDLQLL